MNAQTLANIARTIAHNTGKTIEFDIDGKAYAGANTDRILYKTPKYADLRLTIGAHEEDGLVRAFVHPEDEALAREAVAQF